MFRVFFLYSRYQKIAGLALLLLLFFALQGFTNRLHQPVTVPVPFLQLSGTDRNFHFSAENYTGSGFYSKTYQKCTLLRNIHPAPIPILPPNPFPYMSEPTPSRLIILPADVTILMGCSLSTASRKITQAKDALGKAKQQVLTIKEFCQYYGLDFFESCKLLQLC